MIALRSIPKAIAHKTSPLPDFAQLYSPTTTNETAHPLARREALNFMKTLLA
ncbi:MAG: hypothetical protein AB1589_02920 [Cyanobacteriota bacterium]